jgi:hypothetical protein
MLQGFKIVKILLFAIISPALNAEGLVKTRPGAKNAKNIY